MTVSGYKPGRGAEVDGLHHFDHLHHFDPVTLNGSTPIGRPTTTTERTTRTTQGERLHPNEYKQAERPNEYIRTDITERLKMNDFKTK